MHLPLRRKVAVAIGHAAAKEDDMANQYVPFLEGKWLPGVRPDGDVALRQRRP
ncbi:MAG: hypothetical protein WAJ97_16320 [Terriglobales bacterium]|jgi:hypothetical protein